MLIRITNDNGNTSYHSQVSISWKTSEFSSILTTLAHNKFSVRIMPGFELEDLGFESDFVAFEPILKNLRIRDKTRRFYPHIGFEFDLSYCRKTVDQGYY